MVKTETPDDDYKTPEQLDLLRRWMDLVRRKRILRERWNDLGTYDKETEVQLAETLRLLDDVKRDIARYSRFNGCYFYDGDE